MSNVLVSTLNLGDLILVHPGDYGEGFVSEITEKYVFVNHLHYFLQDGEVLYTEPQRISYWRDEFRIVELVKKKK